MTRTRTIIGIVCAAVIALIAVAMFLPLSAPPQSDIVQRDGGSVAGGSEPPAVTRPTPLPDLPMAMPAPEPMIIIPDNQPSEQHMVESAPPRTAAPRDPLIIEGEDYNEVNLFYATNRAVTDTPNGDNPTDRFLDVDGPVNYGRAVVTIPPNHQLGSVERPGFIMSFISRPNPKRHVVLLDMFAIDRETMIADVASYLNEDENSILVYIHGFNVGMEKAALRAGQLTYDLNWNGPSFFFSWPSQGAAESYTHDLTQAELSEEALQSVLVDLASTGSERIVVIAHSMGTRVLVNALELMSRDEQAALNQISTVILAAPDIDAALFERRILPVFNNMAAASVAAEKQPPFNVTLYASAEDSAMSLSEVVNGQPRIGGIVENIRALFPVNMVDATGAETGFFGHTYINDNATVIKDVYCMLNAAPEPKERNTLIGVPDPQAGPTWKIRTDVASVQARVDNNTGSAFDCGSQ